MVNRVVFLIVGLGFPLTCLSEKACRYDSYFWNVMLKKAVDFHRIVKPYHSLEKNERDPLTGFTVREEDQEAIYLTSIKSFKVCKRLAPQVRYVLESLQSQGVVLDTVKDYRVGKTRGKIDETGNRTQLSSHAFGVAIDINENHNGLYDNCAQFSEQCRLIRGGHWHYKHPRWSGKISGKKRLYVFFA